jgi:hypothetical protein
MLTKRVAIPHSMAGILANQIWAKVDEAADEIVQCLARI